MEILIRIVLAVILGALVGLEREYTQKSAGLRTHILVTLGATLYTLASMTDFVSAVSVLDSTSFSAHHGVLDPNIHIQYSRDPSRIAAQIVSGIGFIGGGAVLRHGATVRGLTTAADLWAMASIGMLIGFGHYLPAIVATCVIFLVLFTIGAIERNFFSKQLKGLNRLRMHIIVNVSALQELQIWMDHHYGPQIIETRNISHSNEHLMDVTYILSVGSKKIDVGSLSQAVGALPGVMQSSVKAYHETEDHN